MHISHVISQTCLFGNFYKSLQIFCFIFIYKACDRDRNGLISAEEFVEVMKLMGDDTITLDQAKAMIKKVDKDGNEQISYDGKKHVVYVVTP